MLHYTQITFGAVKVRSYLISLWPLTSSLPRSQVVTASPGQSGRDSPGTIFTILLWFYWTLPMKSACSSGCFHQVCLHCHWIAWVCVCGRLSWSLIDFTSPGSRFIIGCVFNRLTTVLQQLGLLGNYHCMCCALVCVCGCVQGGVAEIFAWTHSWSVAWTGKHNNQSDPRHQADLWPLNCPLESLRMLLSSWLRPNIGAASLEVSHLKSFEVASQHRATTVPIHQESNDTSNAHYFWPIWNAHFVSQNVLHFVVAAFLKTSHTKQWNAST